MPRPVSAIPSNLIEYLAFSLLQGSPRVLNVLPALAIPLLFLFELGP